MNLPRLLTLAECAELLRCSTQTVRRYIRAGALPTVAMPGRLVRVRDYDLRDFMGT